MFTHLGEDSLNRLTIQGQSWSTLSSDCYGDVKVRRAKRLIFGRAVGVVLPPRLLTIVRLLVSLTSSTLGDMESVAMAPPEAFPRIHGEKSMTTLSCRYLAKDCLDTLSAADSMEIQKVFLDHVHAKHSLQ